MSVSRKIWLLWVVALFIRAPWAMAYEEVEDLVDIFATDSAFIAVVDGNTGTDNSDPSLTSWSMAAGR